MERRKGGLAEGGEERSYHMEQVVAKMQYLLEKLCLIWENPSIQGPVSMSEHMTDEYQTDPL